jgi:hypothetical protein
MRLLGKITITWKAEIGVKVALTSPLSSMSEYFHPVVEHDNLPCWRPPPWLKYQAFLFLIENPSNTCVPSTISVPTQYLEPPKLSGEKREVEEDIESDWIPPYRIKVKKIKLEDPRGNFW